MAFLGKSDPYLQVAPGSTETERTLGHALQKALEAETYSIKLKLMRGLRKLSNFEAITPKRVKPQKQVTLTSRQMVKSLFYLLIKQAHTQEGRNERLIDLLLDRRYKGRAGCIIIKIALSRIQSI